MLLLILQTVAMAGAKPSTPHTYIHLLLSRYCVSVSRFTSMSIYHYQQEMTMFHLHFSGDIPACSPSIRSRLHFWNLSDIARWLLRLLPHQFRFKNLFFFSFFTMYIMHIFYYTGQWPYYHQHLFPTLNRHLYPRPKYGTNPKASDRTIRILPMPLLMLYTFLHLTLMKRKPSWMICCSTIFQSHINMLLPRHRMPFQILRSSPRRHRHLRNASRRPKQLPKHLQSAVAFKTSRDPGLLAL